MQPIDFNFLKDPQVEEELGKRLRKRRVELGWNQTELAKTAGIGRRTVTSVENGGGCSLGTLIAILRALKALPELAKILPPEPISPVALSLGRVKEDRKNPYKPRKKRKPQAAKEPWRWGDEKP